MPEQLTDAEVQVIRQLSDKLPAAVLRLEQLDAKLKTFPDTVPGQLAGVEQSLKELREARDTLERRLGERFDGLETRMNRPGGGAQASDADKRSMRAFDKFLRRGRESLTPEDVKALEGDDPKAGGFLIPAPLRGQIIQELVLTSPIRANAAPVTITQGDSFEDPVDDGSVTAGWVGERQARTATTTPNYGMRKTELREMYAFPQATQRLIDDAGFDLANYIGGKLRERFGQVEGAGFVNGDGGPLQPEGIMNNADVSTINSGDANLITGNGILDLLAAIPTAYAANISLFMNRKTSFALRKLKDSQGRYLWEPGLPVGLLPGLQGNSLLSPSSTFAGVPIVETPDLTDIAANSFPVFTGNLREAYRIVDKQEIRITLDPYTNKPYVGWYATKRTGGKVIVPARIKKLKISV